MRKSYIGFLFGLAAMASALSPMSSRAADFSLGMVLSHALSVCLDRKDAEELLKTDVEKGFEAATAVWNAKEKCAMVPVQGPKVGKVIKSGKVKRDGKELTMSIVEIIGEKGEVMAYFLTTGSVVGVRTQGQAGSDRNA